MNGRTLKKIPIAMKKTAIVYFKTIVSGGHYQQVGHAMPIKGKMAQNVIFSKFGHKIMTIF
jgi:hypothetical protein